MAAHIAGGEIIALEVGPGGIQALEALWAEPVQHTDPFAEATGSRRTLVLDAKREPLRAVDVDDDELVAAGVPDPTLVPLPLWAGAEALNGFSHFGAGARGGVLGAGWWDATHNRLRCVLERCDRAQGFVVATDAGGYGGVTRDLLAYAADECGRRPRVCVARVHVEAASDLARAAVALDAAVALRELRLEADVVVPWRAGVAPVVALTARPLRGRCGAHMDLEAWARFARGPSAGAAGVLVDAVAGTGPDGPFAPVFFPADEHPRDAARRDGLRVAAEPGAAAAPGLFWTPAADADDADATIAEPDGRCARIRAAGPDAAGTIRDLAAHASFATKYNRLNTASSSSTGAVRAAAARADLDSDYLDEVWEDLNAVADDAER